MPTTEKAPVVDASALLKGAATRTPYMIPEGARRVDFASGIIARGVHATHTDADGNPLAVLVFEPRGARAQMIPLAVVAYAVASGLLTPEEVSALQRIGE